MGGRKDCSDLSKLCGSLCFDGFCPTQFGKELGIALGNAQGPEASAVLKVAQEPSEPTRKAWTPVTTSRHGGLLTYSARALLKASGPDS